MRAAHAAVLQAFNKVIDMVESEEVSEADAKGLREKLALEAMAGLRQESAKCFGSTTVPIYLVGCAKKLICKLSPYKQELLELVETGAFFDKLILDIIEARAGHRLHHSLLGAVSGLVRRIRHQSAG